MKIDLLQNLIILLELNLNKMIRKIAKFREEETFLILVFFGVNVDIWCFFFQFSAKNSINLNNANSYFKVLKNVIYSNSNHFLFKNTLKLRYV